MIIKKDTDMNKYVRTVFKTLLMAG